jgi:hypothetical protein
MKTYYGVLSRYFQTTGELVEVMLKVPDEWKRHYGGAEYVKGWHSLGGIGSSKWDNTVGSYKMVVNERCMTYNSFRVNEDGTAIPHSRNRPLTQESLDEEIKLGALRENS